MQQSYTKNYIKIYFWQALSMLLGFASMFAVVPYLSNNPVIYGVYTVCVSMQIFLSYADLGFVGAGQKYAAESFAKKEQQEEFSIIGFTAFILLSFTILLSLVFLCFSFNPQAIIAGIGDGETKSIASKLFLILTIFSLFISIQRVLQLIFSIRLEEYLLQRYVITGNLLKLFSVLWFFRAGHYEVVHYFLFIQLINIGVCVAGFLTAKRRYNYNFNTFIKQIHFNKAVFNKTKNLAISTLVLTFSWIAYYELDTIVIGKIFGVQQVAIYAIGFTVLTFIRSIFGILFSPFISRFNHFVGLKDDTGFNSFFKNIITLTFPLVVFPILIIVGLINPIVMAWVGQGYVASIPIAACLVLCNIFAFIAYPAGQMLMAKERIRDIYIIAIIAPVVYWLGILLTRNVWGLESFAIFKLIIFVLMGIAYTVISLKVVKFSFIGFLKKDILPFIPAALFIIIAVTLTSKYFIGEKSHIGLLKVSVYCAILLFVSLAISYVASPSLKSYVNNIISIKKLKR